MQTLESDNKPVNGYTVGYYSAIALVVVTIISLSTAILTPPLSGPWCKTGCFEYPFLKITSRFPRDYLWMYPSMLLCLIFVVLMASIHQYATETRKVFSISALLFAFTSSSILLVDYFLQVSVIQPSLLNGETDGVSMLTQYNPHGIFIALEELGFSLMSIALLCSIPVFQKKNKLEKAIRATYLIGFFLNVIAFIIISSQFGVKREYRFEVWVITINWVVLIVSGILLTKLFKGLKGEY
jgi:hypothetical protein